MAILSQISSVATITPTVKSGSNAEFDIYTINVAPGSLATYKIVGVSASEKVSSTLAS
jgi:hypothetical protein